MRQPLLEPHAPDPGNGCGNGLRVALRLILLLPALAVLLAAAERDTWLEAADRARQLAESDVPAAYAEALQLQAALPADAPAARRIRALNLLARVQTYLGLTQNADDLAWQALDLAKRNGDRVGQAEAQLTLALTSVNLGKINALIAATANSVEILDGVDRPDLLGEALLRTAMTYRRMGQTDESVLMAMRAMEIARRARNPLALTYAHQGLGLAFMQSGRVLEARQHFEQMRDGARAAHSRLLEADATVGIAGAIEALGERGVAEQRYRKAVTLFRAAGAPLSVNFGQLALAQNLREQRRYAEAQRLFDTAVATYEQYPTPIGLWYALNGRSINQEARGNLGAARADAERADALAKQIDFPLYMGESARRLAALAARAGDHQRAYEQLARATDLSARVANERTSARMLELTQRYEADSRRSHIQELTRRNAEQAAALQRRALEHRWLLTVLFGSAALFIGAAFFLVRLRSLNASLERRVQARTSELRQQTHYLRALIDTLPLSVWLKDTEGHYLTVNRAHAELCGHSPEEMVGARAPEVGPHEMLEERLADDRQVMSSRQRRTREMQHAGPNGPRWIETFKAPVVDEDGSVLGTVGAAHDITERKAAETAREIALTEAERLARLRSEFVAQMSHELRTPLNGILGYAAALQRDPTLTERQSAGVGVIQQSGEHLLRLINDVLDLSKFEAGKIELRPSEFALEPFLRSIASIVTVKADAKHLAFSLELGIDLPSGIRADEQRLRQVLLNLLANAITFTDSGGVKLRVRTLSADRLRFEVQDSGIGISEQHRAIIFQPFEQVASASNRGSGGTGLGLAISLRYVRLMGSEIQVESTPGAGSTFHFDLQVQTVAAESIAEAPTAAAPTPAGVLERFVTPPAPELADLHNLAIQGNMRDIVGWARRVVELDERRYQAFATHVKLLAERYESQAILALVQKHVRDDAGA